MAAFGRRFGGKRQRDSRNRYHTTDDERMPLNVIGEHDTTRDDRTTMHRRRITADNVRTNEAVGRSAADARSTDASSGP